MIRPAQVNAYLGKRGYEVQVSQLANGVLVECWGQATQIARALAGTLERGPFVIVVKRRSWWRRLLRR
jgi:hypothetical protein